MADDLVCFCGGCSAAMLQASEAALGKSALGVGGGVVGGGGGGGGGGGVGCTDQVLNLSRSNKNIQMSHDDEDEEEEEDAIDDHDDHDDLDDADDVDDDEPQDLIVTPQVKH